MKTQEEIIKHYLGRIKITTDEAKNTVASILKKEREKVNIKAILSTIPESSLTPRLKKVCDEIIKAAEKGTNECFLSTENPNNDTIEKAILLKEEADILSNLGFAIALYGPGTRVDILWDFARYIKNVDPFYKGRPASGM